MIPERVEFTGHVIEDPKALIEGRRLRGPIPLDWSRVRFPFEGNLLDLDRWIAANLDGRWSSYTMDLPDGTVAVVAFERLTDAVMFKMNDGETAWQRLRIV